MLRSSIVTVGRRAAQWVSREFLLEAHSGVETCIPPHRVLGSRCSVILFGLRLRFSAGSRSYDGFGRYRAS